MADFETKDSGERAHFDSGMQRDTEAGKARFDLLVPEGIAFEDQMLTRFAQLMARGAEKYAERNWEQADSAAEVTRMKSSAFRHFMQWFCGERDEDHAAAVFFNILAAETTGAKMAGQIDSQPDPDGSDCEEIVEHTLAEWLEIDRLVLTGLASPGEIDDIDWVETGTRSDYEDAKSWIKTRPMTSLEVARLKGRPY